MKKDDSKNAISHMFSLWENEKGFTPTDKNKIEFHPSYREFKTWAENKGYGHYWDFRATGGADYHAEMWFDDYFKQSWRN